MEQITRAKTCQNCQFGQFKKRDWIGASGRSINGLCMKYADATLPPRPYLYPHYVTWTMGERFDNARTIEELPTWEEVHHDHYIVDQHWQKAKENVLREAYDKQVAWSAWWIRNWTTVAERRIDRTTVCDAWDGTQTSKFYKEKKRKR